MIEYQSLFTAGGSENDVMCVFQMSLAAVGAGVLVGRPEGRAVGRVEDDGAVVADPEVVGEEAQLPGAASYELKWPWVSRAAHPHRDVLGARRLHPGEAQVAVAVDGDGGHLDGHARAGVDHALH